MSDFSEYTAGEIVDWMSQGTIASAPSSLYVALFDDTETEVTDDFANGRVETTTGTDWDVVDTGFENSDNISFGEALSDVSSIESVALYTSNTGGDEIALYELSGAPFSISEGSTANFAAGELEFDVIDRTE